MPLRGPTLLCPLMPLADQHLCAQSCPSLTSNFVPTQVLQATHKQPKSHKQQRRHTQALIVLLKSQITKEGHQQENRSNTLKIHTYIHRCNSVVAI
jgi:hypothetical protein